MQSSMMVNIRITFPALTILGQGLRHSDVTKGHWQTRTEHLSVTGYGVETVKMFRELVVRMVAKCGTISPLLTENSELDHLTNYCFHCVAGSVFVPNALAVVSSTTCSPGSPGRQDMWRRRVRSS